MARKFPNFENNENSCWIDSIMTLIAHSRTFKKYTRACKDSQIKKIIEDYQKSLAIINKSEKRHELKKSRSLMHSLQKSTVKNIKEFLKFKEGQYESAFCALLSMIMHDKSNIRKELEASLIWHKQCSNCNAYSRSVIKKSIITLPEVVEFNPAAPTTYYSCMCKKRQKMVGEFIQIPECLLFHFENASGKRESLPVQFSINARHYQLTCAILFLDTKGHGKDHFITCIRQPFGEKWLEFNDMEDAAVMFSEIKPKLKIENIHIAVYETFDNLGKIKTGTFSDEDISASNKCVETIQLMDDSASSSGEENIFTANCKSLCKQNFNEPASNIAVNSMCPENMIDNPSSGSADEQCNILKAYNSFDEKYWNEPSSSTTNSSSHPEIHCNFIKTSDNGHYTSATSTAPDATSSETEKDHNLHAEPMEENLVTELEKNPEMKKRVDNIIRSTFAVFLKHIFSGNEESMETLFNKEDFNTERNETPCSKEAKRKATVDSVSCSGNEENMEILHNEEDFNTERYETFYSKEAKRKAAVESSSCSENEENIEALLYKEDFNILKNKTPCNKEAKRKTVVDSVSWSGNQENMKILLNEEHFNTERYGTFYSEKAKRKAAVNSASCSGNEENMETLPNEEDFNTERNDTPCSSTSTSSSHPENEDFNPFKTSYDGHQIAESVTSNVTNDETKKDDDLHAKPMEENEEVKLLSDPEGRKIVDNAIKRTFAAFMRQIIIIEENSKAVVDSASCSENEENMMPTSLNEEYVNTERRESPCNSTTSFSHPERNDCTNSASSDGTEIYNEDLYLSDNSCAERRN